MNHDAARIRKTAVISAAAIVLIELACFFILRGRLMEFAGILASGLLTLVFFMATLAVYLKAAKAAPQNKLKYLMFLFFAKIAVSAVVFYFVMQFTGVNIMYLLVSFLIFFTIFLNLEIFLIYKRIIFFKS